MGPLPHKFANFFVELWSGGSKVSDKPKRRVCLGGLTPPFRASPKTTNIAPPPYGIMHHRTKNTHQPLRLRMATDLAPAFLRTAKRQRGGSTRGRSPLRTRFFRFTFWGRAKKVNIKPIIVRKLSSHHLNLPLRQKSTELLQTPCFFRCYFTTSRKPALHPASNQT